MRPVDWVFVFVLALRCIYGQKPLYELDKPISADTVDIPYVVGDFIALKLKNQGPVSSNSPATFKCINYARKVEEPYSSRYWPQQNLTLEYPWTEVKRAFWDWKGPITRKAFEDAKQKGVPRCAGCAETLHYKIFDGRLWVASSALDGRGRSILEEILKIALYMFSLPDMEFLAVLGDACNHDGMPRLAYSVCREYQQPGFTMPTAGMWLTALGPTQMTAYHACLAQRFPLDQRKPLAVWRGSTTNPGPVTKNNYWEAPRIKLHLLSRNHSDLLDTRLYRIVQITDPGVIAALNDTLADFMPMEDFNHYCAILHLDGNGWSDRFVNSLIHYPTPILRATTNRTAAVEHLFAPGDSVEVFYNDDMEEGLVAKVREIVKDCARGQFARRRRMVEQKQRLARELMDHVGIVEMLAYSLLAYRNFTTFEVNRTLAGFQAVNMTCCSHVNVPPRFAAEVSAWQGRGAREANTPPPDAGG